MAITPILKAKKVCNLPSFLDIDKAQKLIETMPDVFDVIIRNPKDRNQRSLNQNNYYWFVCGLISEHTGYTPDEVHDIVKDNFLKQKKVYMLNGEPKEIVKIKSTTDLSTKEMEEFLSFVRMWASETFGLFVPLPNEIGEY